MQWERIDTYHSLRRVQRLTGPLVLTQFARMVINMHTIPLYEALHALFTFKFHLLCEMC